MRVQALSALKSLIQRHRSRRSVTSATEGQPSLPARLLDVSLRTWDLGFTAFGGPPVHFRIFHQRFVEGKGGEKWVDEQTVSFRRPLYSEPAELCGDYRLSHRLDSMESCSHFARLYRGLAVQRCFSAWLYCMRALFLLWLRCSYGGKKICAKP